MNARMQMDARPCDLVQVGLRFGVPTGCVDVAEWLSLNKSCGCKRKQEDRGAAYASEPSKLEQAEVEKGKESG